MVNYAGDYTARTRIVYSDTVAGSHKMVIRWGTISDPSTLATKHNAVVSAMFPCLFSSSSINGGDYTLVGSNTWLPLPGAGTGPGTQVGAFDPATMNKAFYIDLSMYGPGVPNAGQYLYLSPPAYNFANEFREADAPAWAVTLRDTIIAQAATTIARDLLVKRSYMIVGQNDEINRKARR